jgi:glycosyltransferase involved in cell wall biosynthesis
MQVCSAEDLGGGERHVADLTRALVQRGHQLHLAVRAASPLPAALRGVPVRWHELGLRNALDVMSAWQLAEVIRAENIDVLHVHLARDYIFCGIAARMVKKAGRPLRFFLTRHHFNPIKAYPGYAWALAEVRALVAVSESVRGTLAEAFPALAGRTLVIPNWLTTQQVGLFSRENARARFRLQRRLAVAVIGQLTPLKRQDLLIKAAANLIIEHHWTEVDFLLIGKAGAREADQEYEAHLQELVEGYGIGEQVRFTGFIRDLPRYLTAFDIVVAPSDDEAFSLALLEAMAAGCAVIAARAGGMAEIVENEATGLLVPPDDLWALVTALSRLLADRQWAAQLGEAARLQVAERFDRDKVIDQIEQLYLKG